MGQRWQMAHSNHLTFALRGTFGGALATILVKAPSRPPGGRVRTVLAALRRPCCLAARQGRIIFGSGGFLQSGAVHVGIEWCSGVF
jgi:hypothetical protein